MSMGIIIANDFGMCKMRERFSFSVNTTSKVESVPHLGDRVGEMGGGSSVRGCPTLPAEQQKLLQGIKGDWRRSIR